MLKQLKPPLKEFLNLSAPAARLAVLWLAALFLIEIIVPSFLPLTRTGFVFDILRRGLFQAVLVLALIHASKKEWRPQLRFTLQTAIYCLGFLIFYFGALKAFDLFLESKMGEASVHLQNFETAGSLIVSILIAPVLEELFFRDLLFRSIYQRWQNILLSVLATSFFFMIAHQSFYGGAFVLGIASSLFYLKTRSIWPSILFHSISNLSWIFLPQSFPHLVGWLHQQNLFRFFYR